MELCGEKTLLEEKNTPVSLIYIVIKLMDITENIGERDIEQQESVKLVI